MKNKDLATVGSEVFCYSPTDKRSGHLCVCLCVWAFSLYRSGGKIISKNIKNFAKSVDKSEIVCYIISTIFYGEEPKEKNEVYYDKLPEEKGRH